MRVWVAAILGLCACAPGPPQPDAEPSTHAIQSERLVRLMRGLERLAVERLPQAMDLQQERTSRAYQVARAAAAIAESAQQLPGAAGYLELPPDARREFARRADQLHRRAKRLADEATHLSHEAMRAQTSAINESCRGCHHRFRIPGVPESP